MLVVRLVGPIGVHGENAIMIAIIQKRKAIKTGTENDIDVGTRKISKIPEKIVALGQINQVKEHCVADINQKYVTKKIVLHVIIVHVIWNAYGRIGVNGVTALRNVAMDIVSGNDIFENNAQ